jgi:hypothetical protein
MPALAAEDDDSPLAAQVAELAKDFTSRCTFAPADRPQQPLVRHPQPILRWSNPTAGQVFGEVYLWTDRGRPAFVASFYKFFTPAWGRTLEVCSLSSEQLVGRREDMTFWTPTEAGLTWRPLTNVDPPAATPAARLVQMRRIAAEFQTKLADRRNNDEHGVERELRQLTQPVFRYSPPMADASYLDGAMFAFVEGTDPEVWLLLEAVGSGKEAAWQFGLARMNRDALQVRRQDQTVWQAPHLDKLQFMDRPKASYTAFSLEHPLRDVRRTAANGK